jgi:hypothetical protein
MSAHAKHIPKAGHARQGAGINVQRLYEYRFRGVDQDARESVWREIAWYIHDRMGGPVHMLDPAAGRGEFIVAVPSGERWGVDRVSHGHVQPCGVKMIIADIMEAELPADHFDGVFLSNFLEHLPDQNAVANVLARLYTTMQADGRIAIIGPNFKYCARDYFDCADHTVILSHVAVTEHLHAAGFEVVAVHPKFLPFSFRGMFPPSARLTRIYLRVPLLWTLLGKQFLIIGRKPASR